MERSLRSEPLRPGQWSALVYRLRVLHETVKANIRLYPWDPMDTDTSESAIFRASGGLGSDRRTRPHHPNPSAGLSTPRPAACVDATTVSYRRQDVRRTLAFHRARHAEVARITTPPLLDAGGVASAEHIARALLAEDRSQIEY